MPKRPPTPPSVDDSQFFTVVNPYPDQPYEALEHSVTFARWIACVIGKENLLAFYHKPKSANVVIIEASKAGFDPRHLLGEHRWYEMLKKPTKEAAAEASAIFPCRKNTGWSLEKVRWLRRDVESSWFNNWSPADDDMITYPYPHSHFCYPPAEDITRERLCCLLRQEMFNDSSTQIVSTRAPDGHKAPRVSSHSPGFSAHEPQGPPGLSPPQFAPAIHGADVPKAAVVAADAPATASSEPSLWSGYGEETECTEQEQLCTTHNVLCHKGICKWCGQRKRAEVREVRVRERQKEKDAWARRREGHAALSQPFRDNSPETSSSGRLGSPGAFEASLGGRERAHKLQLRAEFLISRKEGKSDPTNHAVAVGGRKLPAHLRGGGSKTDSGPSAPVSITSPTTSTFLLSSRTSTADDARSTTSSSYDSSAYISESDSASPRSLHVPAPWSQTVAWHAHAKLDTNDASSLVSGTTRDAFQNPWKRAPPMQAPRPRWGGAESNVSSSGRGLWPSQPARSGCDDDQVSVASSSATSEFDVEPF